MASASTEEGTLWGLFAVGALIGLGRLLASDEPMTLRKSIGHCIVSGGIGVASSLILIPLPDVPLPVIFGAACGLSSLGASTITLLIQRYVEKK